MKTISAICEPGRILLEEEELPVLKENQVLLKAIYSAMSPGTERLLMNEEILPLPMHVGYQMIAEVVEAGSAVEDLRVGDIVATTGRHAQYQVMDEMNCTPCPKGIDLRQAAFFILAHTGMYALRQSNLKLGESCIVLGQGFVGAITAQMAKAAGAMPLIVTDLSEERLQSAKDMGVTFAVNTAKNPHGLKALLEELDLPGASVVFEATGAKAPLYEAADVLAERGRLVMVSTMHGDDMPSIHQAIFEKGAHLIGTYVNSKPFRLKRADLSMAEEWPPLISQNLSRYRSSDIWTSDEDIRVYLDMLKYGMIDINPLISHEFYYTQIPEAYDQYVWKADPSLTGGLIRW